MGLRNSEVDRLELIVLGELVLVCAGVDRLEIGLGLLRVDLYVRV